SDLSASVCKERIDLDKQGIDPLLCEQYECFGSSSIMKRMRAFAASTRPSCARRRSSIFDRRSRSICDSAPLVTSMPGVLLVPEKPTMLVQVVIGCVHDRDAITRRAVPIRLDTIPSKGTATCADVAPAPCAARSIQGFNAAGNEPSGNSGNSPRRSSRMLQSGSFHLSVEEVSVPDTSSLRIGEFNASANRAWTRSSPWSRTIPKACAVAHNRSTASCNGKSLEIMPATSRAHLANASSLSDGAATRIAFAYARYLSARRAGRTKLVVASLIAASRSAGLTMLRSAMKCHAGECRARGTSATV